MSKQSKRHMGAKIKSAEGVDAITVADDGKVGIGTASPTSALDVGYGQIKALSMQPAGCFFGSVDGSINNNSGVVLLHKINSATSFTFYGNFHAFSYTGSGHLYMYIHVALSSNAVNFVVFRSNNFASKIILKLMTVSYNGDNWLAVKKDGGGTGTVAIDALCSGGTPTEIQSGYTIVTTHGTLN